MQIASDIVSGYAMLVALGGALGYRKVGSLPSLIMGGVSALLLLAAAYGLGHGQAWCLPLASFLMLLLLVFFSLRFAKTRAFMPGGLMAVLSLLALAGILLLKK